MGLEKSVVNKFDGQTVVAYHQIDLIKINLQGDSVDLYGRVFVSLAAFQAGREHLETFARTIPKFRELIKTLPSTIESDAYAWLKSLPDFVGATDKTPSAAKDVQA